MTMRFRFKSSFFLAPLSALFLVLFPSAELGPGRAIADATVESRNDEHFAFRLAGAVDQLASGHPDGLDLLRQIASESESGAWGGRANVRIASEALRSGRPDETLCRLEPPASPPPSELESFAESLRCAALVASDRREEAANRLAILLAVPDHPITAERLSLSLLDTSTPGIPLSAPSARQLARALGEKASTDEFRGRAFLGSLLPLLRSSEDWSGYRDTLVSTLVRAPLSVLRTKAIPRDTRTTLDLSTVAKELKAPDRLVRARAFADASEVPSALAELGKIDPTSNDPLTLDEARAFEAELFVRTGKIREALAATESLEAAAPAISDRLTLARGQALLASSTKELPPRVSKGKHRRRRGEGIPPQTVVTGSRRDEALRLLARLDRVETAAQVRRAALEAELRGQWGSGDAAAALETFSKKEKLFPESTTLREEIWNRGFSFFREGDYQSALTFLDALSSAADPGFSRRGAYWAARCRMALGQLDEAASAFTKIATVPAVDFYARHAARRLTELGRAVPAAVWTLESPDKADTAGLPKPLLALERIGLYAEALDQIPDRPNLSHALRVKRAELLARTGERDRAMVLLRQIHPEIQTAGAGALPEGELRLFYPLAYGDLLRSSAERYRIDLPSLVGLVRQESGFRPIVRSTAGALGLMQIMPSTAKLLGRRMFAAAVSKSRLNEADLSIEMGSFYLRDLMDRLGGDFELALAGYNCGPGRVAAVKKRWPHGDTDLWVESLPFAETRDYVKKIVLYTSVYKKLYPDLTEPVRDTPPASAGGR